MNLDLYDVVVIGAGSGGVRTARRLALRGRRVALVEDREVGGTCVVRGCIPKKMLAFGAELGVDWATARDRARAEVTRLVGVYEKLQTSAGVEIVRGRGRVTSEADATLAVAVDLHGGTKRTLLSPRVVLATGGRPIVPEVEGAELGLVSDDVFGLATLPKSIVVVGGGFVALEFASILRGFGAEVTVVHRSKEFLRGYDREAVALLLEEMAAHGVRFEHSLEVGEVRGSRGGLEVALRGGAVLRAEQLLWAVGRRPVTEGLGLDAVGVVPEADGRLRVDARYATSHANVFAVGDLVASRALTPVALGHANALVRVLADDVVAPLDEALVPSAVFATPTLAAVGLSEEEAVAAGHDVVVFASRFVPLRERAAGGLRRALVKLVVEESTERLLGCVVVGPEAAEVVQGFAVAVRLGLSKAALDGTVAIHPTLAEELVTMSVATRRVAGRRAP